MTDEYEIEFETILNKFGTSIKEIGYGVRVKIVDGEIVSINSI